MRGRGEDEMGEKEIGKEFRVGGNKKDERSRRRGGWCGMGGAIEDDEETRKCTRMKRQTARLRGGMTESYLR
jgi:hypothetical protein